LGVSAIASCFSGPSNYVRTLTMPSDDQCTSLQKMLNFGGFLFGIINERVNFQMHGSYP
jgi:hypothetical protein